MEFASQSVSFANTDQVKLGIENDLYLTIPPGRMKDLKASYTLNNTELQAPLAKNEVVGTINLKLDNKIVEQRPLLVLKEVDEGGFFSKILDYIKLFFQRWFG
ncbi:D-alanyl-D-alanine carboxypeptidase DacA [Arsenophonus endosymbiont of Bemisia tabaci Q2]|nr:D-alanyl-D-alanine carboxypeptidase DacA [Arsenophonus endosymbiont of Bemisia tabaci Q2]